MGANVIADLSGCDEQIERAPLAITDRVQLGVHSALGASDQVSRPPLFYAHADHRSVGLEIGCIDHHGIQCAILGSQSRNHFGEYAPVATPLPTGIERFVWARSRGSVAPRKPLLLVI